MTDRLRLEVVTPRRKVLDREADEIRLPGALGELGVLPGHTPLLTNIEIGPLTIIDGTETTKLAIFGGFAEVLPNRVTVLARDAEESSDIDVEAAQKSKTDAEDALKTADAKSLVEITNDLKMAVTRLEVASPNE
jgi:F-type H+-transporting ATPase subunit epsilon